MADRVEIPVDLNIEAIQKKVVELKAVMENALKHTALKMVSGEVPIHKPSVSATSEFEVEGKKYRAQAKSTIAGTPELVLGENGEKNISFPTEISAVVKEIRSATKKVLANDVLRLKEFKNSIKFQPLEVKKEKITEFLDEFKRLQNSTKGLLPTEQIAEIRKFITSTPTIAPTMVTSFTDEVNAFEKSIDNLSDDDKSAAISNYVKKFGDVNNELADRLSKVSSSLDKQDFKTLSTRVRRLSPKDQIRAAQEYIQAGGKSVDEAENIVAKAMESLRKQKDDFHIQKFKELKTKTRSMDLNDAIVAYQDYINQAGAFSDQAEIEVRKLRKKLAVENFKATKFNIANKPIQEQKETIEKYDTKGSLVRKEARKELRRLEGVQFKELKDSLSGLSAEEKIKALDAYAQLGTPFATKARNNIARLKGTATRQNYANLIEDISVKPLEEQKKAILDYINSGGKMINKATKDLQTVRKKMFTAVKEQAELQPTNVAINTFEQYKSTPDALHGKANKEIKRLRSKEFRELKDSISSLSPDEKIKALEDYANLGKPYTIQANNLIAKLKGVATKQNYTRLKESVELKPLTEQRQAILDYINNGGKLVNKATKDAIALTAKIKAESYKNLKTTAMNLPLEDQIKEYEKYLSSNNINDIMANQANKDLRSLKKKLTTTKIAEFKSTLTDKPLPDQILAYEQYIANRNVVDDKFRNELGKMYRKVAGTKFKDIKLTNIGKSLEDQLKAFENYIVDINNDTKLSAFDKDQRIKPAKSEIVKINKQIKTRDFQNVKDHIDLSGLSTDDAIKEWDNYIATPGAMIKQAKIEQAKLRTKLASETKNLKRAKFHDWTKDLELLSPKDQLIEIEKFINNGPAEFIKDAKIMRQKLQRQLKQQAEQQKREKNKQFANNVLIGAGAGLGLLGPLGFPLLNVGFAAMSGGPVGAGIAAISTVIGESVRAINSLGESAKQAAKELNFVSIDTKISDTKLKALEAIAGARVNAAERVANDRLFDITKSNINAGTVPTVWSNIKESYYLSWMRRIHGDIPEEEAQKSGVRKFAEWMIDSFDPLGSRRAAEEYFGSSGLGQKTKDAFLPELEAARRSMMIGFSKPIGIETDPYETWKRIQNAAYDPSKAEDVRLRQETLTVINQQIEAIKQNTAALTTPAVSSPTVSGPLPPMVWPTI